MELVYGVTIRPDADVGFLVRSRDVPELLTWGGSSEDARTQAEDALEVVLRATMEEGRDIPLPSPIEEGEEAIAVPARLAAKVSVYAAWRAAGISKSALAVRMGRSEGEVRRILDPNHGTRIEQMDEAARALGGRLIIGFERAA